ncbi:hypothetical protein [Dyadobacter sp. CY312]|uniref:hypothetical protein n=1 Tax=Dyadobacter sp. CY312 TaxID=2907303 RepID=UPI001F239C2D|nr:hypothetical protein [Dyadobacter sp. CY312]MCE7041071.1 hypothetical protein [Dyadobacter sp. CY312]
MKNLPLLLLCVLVMTSCWPEDREPINGIEFDGTAYKPIYATEAELQNVKVTESLPLTSPGKIYLLDPYLFVNESGKGIHIIDNSDPKNPKNLSFISILGNYDIAAKGNWLYVDNVTDLIVFDISDPKQPKLAKRIANAIPANSYPPFQNIYFECVDTKKGTVVGWEKVPMNAAPNCYR